MISLIIISVYYHYNTPTSIVCKNVKHEHEVYGRYCLFYSSRTSSETHAQVEETDSDYSDLLLHTDVRWLSSVKFLQRFRELRLEKRDFLVNTKHAKYKGPDDNQPLTDVAFLTDLTNIMNDLILDLQGKDKTTVGMINSVNALKEAASDCKAVAP